MPPFAEGENEMKLSTNSSVAELRNEIERKRKKAQELQMNTTDPDEWASLNILRWELEDLDKDLYLSQFIKNTDKLAKLVGKIEGATTEAQKLVNIIEDVEQALKSARAKLKSSSPMINEIKGFLDEVDAMMKVMKA
jgi:cell fate (sporulation/competence/biofilm development) regulator YlbF (YheA/YmcA/DUF963 family)